MIYADGVAVPEGPDAAAADAAAKALLEAAGVQGGFSGAAFVGGPARDSRRGLRLTLRAGHQVGQLFRARAHLRTQQIANYVD